MVDGFGFLTVYGEGGVAGYDHGLKEAEKRNKSESASEFALPVHRDLG